jgi:hypothetical protein
MAREAVDALRTALTVDVALITTIKQPFNQEDIV